MLLALREFGYAIQLILFIWAVYGFVISMGAFVKKDEEIKGKLKKNKFALIVSAHNEQAVIANLVHSLKHMDYKSNNYDIFVIADNCTDNTADIARRAGANVYERTDNEKVGKGYALEWMFKQIFEMEVKYDYIGIFDADNLVSKNFLTVINKKINQGYKVIQGYLDSKNPDDNWISYSHSLTYWITNKMFQEARSNIGLSSELGGTGFVMCAELLKDYGWGATCLTEDLEFTMKLAMNGIKVAWAEDAKIYDEKPLTLKQSWRQRVRWMQGHTDVCVRFSGKLLKKGIKEGKLFLVDNALYLMQPISVVVSAIVGVVMFFASFVPEYKIMLWQFVPGYIVNIFFLFSVGWPLLILAMEKKFTKKTLGGYVIFLLFSLTWIPVIISGVINSKKKVWAHTQHTRAISVNEVAAE